MNQRSTDTIKWMNSLAKHERLSGAVQVQECFKSQQTQKNAAPSMVTVCPSYTVEICFSTFTLMGQDNHTLLCGLNKFLW
jgi:hypothetical protein